MALSYLADWPATKAPSRVISKAVEGLPLGQSKAVSEAPNKIEPPQPETPRKAKTKGKSTENPATGHTRTRPNATLEPGQTQAPITTIKRR
jgi:hypothetical protein